MGIFSRSSPPDDIQEKLSSMKENIEAMHQHLGAFPLTMEERSKLRALGETFQTFQFKHPHIFELQLKLEEAKWVLSTLIELGIETDKAHDLKHRLETIVYDLSTGPETERESQRISIRKAISALQKELESLSFTDNNRHLFFRGIVRDFKRIHSQLKSQVSDQTLSDDEREVLSRLQEECSSLKASCQSHFILHLRIHEAKQAISELEEIRPLPLGLRKLDNDLTLFIDSLQEDRGGDANAKTEKFYTRILEDINLISNELEVHEAPTITLKEKQSVLTNIRKGTNQLIRLFKPKKKIFLNEREKEAIRAFTRSLDLFCHKLVKWEKDIMTHDQEVFSRIEAEITSLRSLIPAPVADLQHLEKVKLALASIHSIPLATDCRSSYQKSLRNLRTEIAVLKIYAA